ncbi:hypothetical protein AMTRI_Chr07g26950 [Amborella trichopoda]
MAISVTQPPRHLPSINAALRQPPFAASLVVPASFLDTSVVPPTPSSSTLLPRSQDDADTCLVPPSSPATYGPTSPNSPSRASTVIGFRHPRSTLPTLILFGSLPTSTLIPVTRLNLPSFSPSPLMMGPAPAPPSSPLIDFRAIPGDPEETISDPHPSSNPVESLGTTSDDMNPRLLISLALPPMLVGIIADPLNGDPIIISIPVGLSPPILIHFPTTPPQPPPLSPTSYLEPCFSGPPILALQRPPPLAPWVRCRRETLLYPPPPLQGRPHSLLCLCTLYFSIPPPAPSLSVASPPISPSTTSVPTPLLASTTPKTPLKPTQNHSISQNPEPLPSSPSLPLPPSLGVSSPLPSLSLSTGVSSLLPPLTLEDLGINSAADPFGLTSGIFRPTIIYGPPTLGLSALPSPSVVPSMVSSKDSLSIDTFEDPRPPPMDSNYVNGIDAGQGRTLDAMQVMDFPHNGSEGPFLQFFKDDAQSKQEGQWRGRKLDKQHQL